jgi:hypothetical protein
MIDLKVVIETVYGKDAAVELTEDVFTACLERNFYSIALGDTGSE